jgi:hypothetical protein
MNIHPRPQNKVRAFSVPGRHPYNYWLAELAVQSRLLEIELEYCDDPSCYPSGGHLEIVGRKNS